MKDLWPPSSQENNAVSKQLEERRKAREKQREEMRMRIQNQKLNLKAQKRAPM